MRMGHPSLGAGNHGSKGLLRMLCPQSPVRRIHESVTLAERHPGDFVSPVSILLCSAGLGSWSPMKANFPKETHQSPTELQVEAATWPFRRLEPGHREKVSLL